MIRSFQSFPSQLSKPHLSTRVRNERFYGRQLTIDYSALNELFYLVGSFYSVKTRHERIEKIHFNGIPHFPHDFLSNVQKIGKKENFSKVYFTDLLINRTR